jgi:hypothetical protein
VLLWQGYIWRVTASSAYRKPAYAYQRAPYYYANVSYRENGSLLDPFRPELGQSHLWDVGTRIASNLSILPVSLGESAFVPLSYWRTFLDRPHRKLSMFLPADWREWSLRAVYSLLVSVGLLAAVGIVLIAIGPQWFLSIYFAITLALIAFTPWQSQFWRYLASVTPLTLIFFVFSLLQICRWLALRYSRCSFYVGMFVPTGLAVALFLQAGVAAQLLRNIPSVSYFDAGGRERPFHLLTYGSNWHALDYAFEWVRRHAPADAIVATTVPHLAYLRSQHKAVLPPFELDPETAGRLLDQVPVSYLVLDELGVPAISERYAAPIVEYMPQQWRLVFTAPDDKTRVYERLR